MMRMRLLIPCALGGPWLSSLVDPGVRERPRLERTPTVEELFRRHSDDVRRIVTRLLGPGAAPSDVEDLVQQVFVVVHGALPRFRGDSKPVTWLYGIARNKAVDRLRRSRRTTLRDLPDDTIADDAPSPLAVIEAASDAERLRACIAKLTPAQQSAVRLTFFEDLSCPEAAEVEGVPVGTIKTRIHHAKKLLMHCLTRSGAV